MTSSPASRWSRSMCDRGVEKKVSIPMTCSPCCNSRWASAEPIYPRPVIRQATLHSIGPRRPEQSERESTPYHTRRNLSWKFAQHEGAKNDFSEIGLGGTGRGAYGGRCSDAEWTSPRRSQC